MTEVVIWKKRILVGQLLLFLMVGVGFALLLAGDSWPAVILRRTLLIHLRNRPRRMGISSIYSRNVDRNNWIYLILIISQITRLIFYVRKTNRDICPYASGTKAYRI
jgi:hypothetical protein